MSPEPMEIRTKNYNKMLGLCNKILGFSILTIDDYEIEEDDLEGITFFRFVLYTGSTTEVHTDTFDFSYPDGTMGEINDLMHWSRLIIDKEKVSVFQKRIWINRWVFEDLYSGEPPVLSDDPLDPSPRPLWADVDIEEFNDDAVVINILSGA